MRGKLNPTTTSHSKQSDRSPPQSPISKSQTISKYQTCQAHWSAESSRSWPTDHSLTSHLPYCSLLSVNMEPLSALSSLASLNLSIGYCYVRWCQFINLTSLSIGNRSLKFGKNDITDNTSNHSNNSTHSIFVRSDLNKPAVKSLTKECIICSSCPSWHISTSVNLEIIQQNKLSNEGALSIARLTLVSGLVIRNIMIGDCGMNRMASLCRICTFYDDKNETTEWCTSQTDRRITNIIRWWYIHPEDAIC